MTRIAAGAGAPNPPSNESLVGQMARAGMDAVRTDGATEKRSGGGSHEIGPDRPVPQTAIGGRQPATDGRVFLKDLTRWEGEHRCMYVDTRGFVTTGIGHLLKNVDQALTLPWHHSGTGRPATPAEVKAAFEHLGQAWTDLKRDNPNANGMSVAKCRKLSDLVLPEGLPVKLACDRLDTEFLKDLRRIFPGFDSYPMPAQRALVDMAYNLGVGKLEGKFPKLLAACRGGDFASAAAESHRSSSRKERNDVTRDLFMEAAQLQASLQTLGKGVRL